MMFNESPDSLQTHKVSARHTASGAHGDSDIPLALHSLCWSSLGEDITLTDCSLSQMPPLYLRAFGRVFEHTEDPTLRYCTNKATGSHSSRFLSLSLYAWLGKK
jgi:hypothetical protein